MKNWINRTSYLVAMIYLLMGVNCVNATDLADQPLTVSRNVPGNVAFTPSVEFPTALGSSYRDSYNPIRKKSDGVTLDPYLGYFDSEKCYDYVIGSTADKHYFEAVGSTDKSHACSGHWSGNFLNWALTQTIDPFRFALTGGYRVVDEVGLTVLEKAYASGQGGGVATPTVYNNATVISGATPFSVSNLTIRIAGMGTDFTFTSCNPNALPTGYTSCVNYINAFGKTSSAIISDTNIPQSLDNSKVYRMHAAVRACKPSFLETNCTAYGSDYKPEGLIQKNALKLNYAAFGYLNDGNSKRDGGVLRARMAQVGPQATVPNSASVTNANAEWDASTGIFVTNPDPVDAKLSGVTNSGVINYINKFGKNSQTYKTYDPVSELYYTAIRYFKNLGNVPAYTNNLTATYIDGFPVITDWSDPVNYECQKNFIIGIGDTNTWLDANLPGSTIANATNEPAMPTEVSADTTVDVRVATNRVGAMQGAGNLGDGFTPHCCTGNTFFIAGLAYDSHTKDISTSQKGTQTITTYWLDVLENGSPEAANRNQYLLAAKFGGFTVPDGFSPYDGTAQALTTSQWDANGDGYPDNYFQANNPALMISGLNSAFADAIKQVSGASTVLSIPSASVASGGMSYGSTFTSTENNIDVWTGDVLGNKLSVSASGDISTTLVWKASTKLESLTNGTGWDGTRVIATSKCVVDDSVSLSQTCTGVPFRYSNLDANMQASLGDSANNQQQNRLNYLRGDRSKEGTSYRVRKQILGDIVNSQVSVVAQPSAPYADNFNVGYSTFKKTSRKTVVYVGGNDGFLHAFDGAETGGNELFAYAPNALFSGPNNTPLTDGLAALANTAFAHHYYVDATPAIQDVNFSTTLADWHTLLVGGLGKGGKAYYCLDITNPSSLTSESGLSSAVKWEFKNANLGYTYGRPTFVKVKLSNGTKKWVIIVTSGYNNADRQGHFFILDPATGKLIQDIPTGEIPAAKDTEAGMSQVTAYVSDRRDWTADAAYAADLQGNVWRLDLSGTVNSLGSYARPTKIISVGTPITVPPVVEVDQTTLKRYVFVGTGRLLATSDINTAQDNYIFAFNDGSNTTFYTSSTTPVAFPWTKSNLVNDTNSLTTGISTTQPSSIIGYYISTGAYRITIPMRSAAGVIVVGANQTTGDACNPAGTGRLYAFTYGTGTSVLLSGSSSTTTVPYADQSTTINSVGIITTTSNGVTEMRVVTNNNGTLGGAKINQGTSGSVVMLNWRELPVNN